MGSLRRGTMRFASAACAVLFSGTVLAQTANFSAMYSGRLVHRVEQPGSGRRRRSLLHARRRLHEPDGARSQLGERHGAVGMNPNMDWLQSFTQP